MKKKNLFPVSISIALFAALTASSGARTEGVEETSDPKNSYTPFSSNSDSKAAGGYAAGGIGSVNSPAGFSNYVPPKTLTAAQLTELRDLQKKWEETQAKIAGYEKEFEANAAERTRLDKQWAEFDKKFKDLDATFAKDIKDYEAGLLKKQYPKGNSDQVKEAEAFREATNSVYRYRKQKAALTEEKKKVAAAKITVYRPLFKKNSEIKNRALIERKVTAFDPAHPYASKEETAEKEVLVTNLEEANKQISELKGRVKSLRKENVTLLKRNLELLETCQSGEKSVGENTTTPSVSTQTAKPSVEIPPPLGPDPLAPTTTTDQAQ